MATTIQSLIQSAAPGSTVIVPAGTYNVSGLVLPGNITLKAGGNVTLNGNLTVGGNNTTISGFTFAGGTVNIGNTTGTKIENSVFNGGSRAINLDNAKSASIVNNEFHKVSGNVIAGWGLDQSTISGNKFYDSWQPINLNFNNNHSQGRNITIENNYFTGTQRMPIEVGPAEAYTLNMVVRGNWSENMNNAGSDRGWSTDVAYSLVQGNGVNTVITGNYAKGIGTGVGIELNGSGEIYGNYIENFWYGSIVYGKGFNVHDNAFVGDYIERVLNYGNQSGTIANNKTSANGFPMPKKPGSAPATTEPKPTEPKPADPDPVDTDPAPTDGKGSGHPVIAVDDNYKIDVNQSHWFNTRHILMNDKGLDGGLKVTKIDSKSAAGGTVTLSSDGTVKYTPVKNWQGKDSIEYTVVDKDGSSDTGTIYFQVGNGSSTTTPKPAEPAPSNPPVSGGGTGNPVVAGDDYYKTNVDQKWYFNTKYLLLNDKGLDGGLKVTAVASKSAAGATVTLDEKGTAIYTPLKGWQGHDTIEYTLVDKDGSTDIGIVHMQVGDGTATTTPPSSGTTNPPPSNGGNTGGSTGGSNPAPSTGTGNPVVAGDDYQKTQAGSKYYFNSKYLLMNDTGKDGGLKVTEIGTVTEKGGTVKWDASTGTAIYTPKTGFSGKDAVDYTVVDKDGSQDIGTIHFDVLLA